jgi:hypothetical protein
MEVPVSTTAHEMNWADYCDSLSNEYFKWIPQPSAKVRSTEKLPDPVSILVARQEAARELAPE